MFQLSGVHYNSFTLNPNALIFSGHPLCAEPDPGISPQNPQVLHDSLGFRGLEFRV